MLEICELYYLGFVRKGKTSGLGFSPSVKITLGLKPYVGTHLCVRF